MNIKLLSIIIVISLFFACSPKTANDQTTDESPATWQKDATLNLYLIAKPVSFDPVAISDLYSQRIVSLLIDTLYRYDYFNENELLPTLATGLPKISDDGLTYTFSISPGVYYYDPQKLVFDDNEREIISSDFIYMILRHADLTQNSAVYWMLQDKIVGLDQWRENSVEGGDYNTLPEGIKYIDDYTFSITLTQVYPQLLYIFARSNFGPMPPEYRDAIGEDITSYPIGSGPYYLDIKNTITNNKYILKKNPTYRDVYITSPNAPEELQGLQLPLNSGIQYFVIEENSPAWLLFQQGNLDVYSPSTDQFDQAISGAELTPAMKEKGVKLHIKPRADIVYGSYNFENSVWGSIMQSESGKLIRRALRMGYDTQTEIDILRNGRAVIAQTPIPPEFTSAQGIINPYLAYDVQKAKALLAEAGYPNGEGLPVLTVLQTANTFSENFYELFSRYMAELGIKTAVETTDWPGLIKAIDEGGDTFELVFMAWGGDYPDAQNFLQLFYGPYIAPNGSNYSRYNNAEYNTLFESASKLLPGPERTELYRQMISILIEDAPWFLGIHRVSYVMTNQRIKNYKIIEYNNGSPRYYQIMQ